MKRFTYEELDKMDHRALVAFAYGMQDQLEDINRQLNIISEQLALMNQRQFGRKTEKSNEIEGQISLFDFLDEAEFLQDESPEPEIQEITVSSYKKSKTKGKRDKDLDGLPARIFEHELSAEELAERFPEGYKELPVQTYKRLAIIPATLLVDEHHVHIYASKSNDGTIVRAKRPADLFRNSIATPSIVASIINAKYSNHLPLERQSRAFKDYGVKLETNTMANWVIESYEKYLHLIYDALHSELYYSNVIHADETPTLVINDGRETPSKSYMWVYRTGARGYHHDVTIYDYQKTRRTDHPREFLKDYNGVVTTDGYQVYHKLDNECDNLNVSGCWVHAKRGFAELVKALPGDVESTTVASEAVKKISKIFHEDNKLNDLTKKDRERKRKIDVKPKVDAFFAWAKEVLPTVPSDGKTAKALNYCLNQEKYLRVFLKNGNVEMDNNRAEQAIRPFTIGRKNWVFHNSIRGAQASACIYSIVETAKANGIKTYDYLNLLLEEIPQRLEDNDNNPNFIQDLLPWSDYVKSKCHTQISAKSN